MLQLFGVILFVTGTIASDGRWAPIVDGRPKFPPVIRRSFSARGPAKALDDDMGNIDMTDEVSVLGNEVMETNDGHDNLVPVSGQRRLEMPSDVLVYEDIYPKRIPSHMQEKWDSAREKLEVERAILAQKAHRRALMERERRRRRMRMIQYRRRSSGIRGRRSRAQDSENSLMRSLLGVSPYCSGDGETLHTCTFTPSCWMAGGIAHAGCESMLYSCCVMPNIKRHDNNLVESGRYFTPQIPVEFVKKRKSKPILLRNEPECGLSKQGSFSKRIIGGNRAQFAELPWQVHIRISSYQCGGVLLNHWYVATAAHCVHQAKLSQITVHLGEFDTKNTEEVDEPLGSESFKVDEIVLHPEFRYMLTQPDRYDIALLKLDHPVLYRDNIIPICLPSVDMSLVGKVGVVAGWGKTDNSFGKTGTNLLHKVLVPIIENGQCRRWHKDKAIAVQLHEEMFCAGHKDGKMDACLGDSGGPLVINFDGRWTLIGITSAGFGCAVEKQPGIYHKVSKTARWIYKMISK